MITIWTKVYFEFSHQKNNENFELSHTNLPQFSFGHEISKFTLVKNFKCSKSSFTGLTEGMFVPFKSCNPVQSCEKMSLFSVRLHFTGKRCKSATN